MNSHFHFLGICGTAMGAVAAAMARRRYCLSFMLAACLSMLMSSASSWSSSRRGL